MPDLSTSRRALIAATLGTALTPLGARAAAPLTIAHASGTTEAPARPARTVVFDLGALDTLDALGVPIAGVPKWRMPPPLARYEDARYAKVGSLFVPDEEAVHALKPELIVIGSRVRDKYERLARIAPTIDLTADPRDFYGSIARNAQTLGRLHGREAEVAAKLRRLDASIAQLRQQTAAAGNALILMTTGGKISAHGPGSRFGVLHDQFGMAAADRALKPATHGQAVSYEYILRINPDWLFVIDRDAAIGAQGKSAQQLLDNPLVARTKAWKSRRVVYLDPVPLYLTSAGLRSEQLIVDTIIAALQR